MLIKDYYTLHKVQFLLGQLAECLPAAVRLTASKECPYGSPALDAINEQLEQATDQLRQCIANQIPTVEGEVAMTSKGLIIVTPVTRIVSEAEKVAPEGTSAASD